jgi:hypothetical protein
VRRTASLICNDIGDPSRVDTQIVATMTPFCFEHVFRVQAADAVFAAYFDPELQLEQDRAIEIAGREILELRDDGSTLHRKSRVTPRRKIPAFLKPLLGGELRYIENVTWRRPDDEIDIDIEILPARLNGRIRALYGVERRGEHEILRRYRGSVSVNVALLSTRIERGIVAEFARSMPVAAECTQSWLDRQVRSLTAQA